MQFEEFDSKLKEAAENHHPAYDEKAWAKMEKLLDKHLPREEERKRRFIFFLLFFLVLGGGSFWLFSSKPWKGNKKMATAEKTIQKPAGDITATVYSDMQNTNPENDKVIKKEVAGISAPGIDQTKTISTPPGENTAFLNSGKKNVRKNNTPANAGFKDRKLYTDQPVLSLHNNPDGADQSKKKDQEDKRPEDAATANTIASTLIPDQKNDNQNPVSNKNLAIITPATKPVVTNPLIQENAKKENTRKENTRKENTSLVQNSREKKAKEKNKKGNTFFFTLSAGPDVSATGTDKPGKARFVSGGGLGYTFKDRLTIRSGFYTARKIYTSSPGSYHPPANFWNYYPYLEKVDGDCKVYEIPLYLSYNIGHSSKQNWFVSTGLSSYLMKKETYKYYYKSTPAGPTYTRQYTPRNKNNNYFSVLTLSGGYQKNIGRSFSVIVEPYVKFPLTGVGLGKVKLNSGGLLFSVAVKPFAGSGKHSNPHR